jgi:hypothetical protein
MKEARYMVFDIIPHFHDPGINLRHMHPEDFNDAYRLHREIDIGSGRVRFVYTEDAWMSQFIERPGSVEVVEIGDRQGLLIYEDKKDQISIVSLELGPDLDFGQVMRSILNSIPETDQGLFYYSTVPREWSEMETLGARIMEGTFSSITLVGEPGDSCGSELIRDEWTITKGDKM